MTTALAERTAMVDGGAAVAAKPARPWHAVAIVAETAPLAGEWRRLQAEGLVTPYQSLAWVEAYVASVGTAGAMEFRFAAARAADGALLALLPLVITRRLGVRFAEFLGGKHANYHMGLFDRRFADGLDREAAARLLREIGAAIGGIDAFLLVNQPAVWEGVANPLARLAAGPSPSRAYKLALAPGDGEAVLRRSMSSHARKKLKNKRNRFAEFGAGRLWRAIDAAGRERVLETFLRQKAMRFSAMGLPDPFAAPGVREFLRRGAEGEAPAIELWSLDIDGTPVATYVGAVHGRRFSGMATSFDLASIAARTSPGEILLVDLIRLKCAEGYAVFDLGVGEARYKTTICDDHDDLVDSFLPLTSRGRAYAAFSRLKRLLKARIKRSPAALRLAHRVSGWLGRRRREVLDEG